MPEVGLGGGFDPPPLAPHAAASTAIAARNTHFFIAITQTSPATLG
jgi:hypothetical protein